MKYVDSHAHVFKPGLKLAAVRRYAPSYEAITEDFIRNFESKGLTGGMLIQPSFLGSDNSFMIEAIDAYPTKLYGVAVVEPTCSFEALKELNAHNVVGIRLNLYGVEPPDLLSVEYQKLLGYLKRLDWHVELHTDAINLKSFIEPILDAGVKVVVDHWGKPIEDNPLEDEGFNYLLSKGETKQVWVKISGVYRLKKDADFNTCKQLANMMFPKLLEMFGAERLLWGSDWPHTNFEDSITYDDTWNAFVEMVSDDNIRQQILGKSFAQLLPKVGIE